MTCSMRKKENLLNTESYRSKYNCKKYSFDVKLDDLDIYFIVFDVPKID